MPSTRESDISIKAGADLLLKGWKMLNKACPECVEPLYEKEGKVVCVKCKKNYVMVDSLSDIPQEQKPSSSPVKQVIQKQKPSPSNDFTDFNFDSLPPTLAESAKIMTNKLSDLNKRLKEATEPKEISEISSSIRSLIDSLRSLSP
ncbi:MAG: hypothetical protein KAS63_01015 [Candidatus Heimdallarchaeota archaeon]|nr:hypothetical protein [Candidatus Heimdallarchaeota archaeon]MCK4953923.1 hypothetical protein [Candidatus Heimdallarchaeota archaeon]